MSVTSAKVRDALVLVTVACVNLLGILDTTIVTNAIPSASVDLQLDADGRQWIVTAYALAFGAMLLIGGRVADYWGRKKTLILGVVLFSAASAWGGLANSGLELLLARALQGGSGALMAPAALSIVTVTFVERRSRAIAFGTLGGITAAGATVGLIVGGLLTQAAGWRWCLLVNVPVGAAAVVLAAVVLRESRAEGPARYDIVGAITVSAGLAALALGLTRRGSGAAGGLSLLLVAVGILLIGVFVFAESRVAWPMLPLGVVLNRARGGALLVQICSGTVMAAVTLYLTLHLQQVLLLTPLFSGLAMVPLALGVTGGIPLFVRISNRIGVRATLVLSPSIAAIGILWLAQISVSGSYWVQILPGLLVMGFGMAGVFVTAQNLALQNVRHRDAGAASAASQAAGQVGGALGLALLTTAFLAASGSGASARNLVHGYAVVFVCASAVMVAAAVIALLLIRAPGETGETVETEDTEELSVLEAQPQQPS